MKMSGTKIHNSKDTKTQATEEFMEAMDNMHKPMMIGIMDKNTDVAFIKGMLPHHQGAVDMAKIELKYGKDKELKEFARQIVDIQDKQIYFMKTWLKKNTV